MSNDYAADIPSVAQVDATLAADERSVLIEMRDHDGGLNRFCIGTHEIHEFVTMLLRVANLAGVSPSEWPATAPSIPTSAICVAERDDGGRCIGIRVGPTTLFFEIPVLALSSVGELLLQAGPSKRRLHS